MSAALVELLLGEADRRRARERLLELDVILAGVAATMSKEGGKVYRDLRAALVEMADSRRATMGDAQRLNILISIREQLAGLERSVAGMRQLREEGTRASDAIKLGFGVELMRARQRPCNRSLDPFARPFLKACDSTPLSSLSQLGIAAVLKQFDQKGKYADFRRR